MKTVHKLVVTVGLLIAGGAFASTADEQTYLKTYRQQSGAPVPLTVVAPVLPDEYSGKQVKVVMVISKTGVPGSIKVMDNKDVLLETKLTEALAQWRFAPALRDGEPIEVAVELPVNFVDGFRAARYASN